MSELPRIPDNLRAPSRPAIPDHVTLHPDYGPATAANAGDPINEEILVELTRQDIQVLLDVSVGAKWGFEISLAELQKARQDCYDMAEESS